MKQRLITAALIVVAMVCVLLLSWTYVFPAVLSLLAVLAIFEVLRVFNMHKHYSVSVAAYILALALPIAAYVMVDIGYTVWQYVLVMALALFCFMFYLFGVSVFRRGEYPFGEIAGAFMMTVYVVSSFS